MMTRILNLKLIRYALYALIVVGLLVTVFTPNYYLFIRGSEYANQIMLGYFFLGLTFLIFRQPKLTFTSFACCAGLCLFLKNSTNAEIKTPVVTEAAITSVAHFNLSSADTSMEDMVQAIKNTGTELVSIQEVTPDWVPVLNEALETAYPYSVLIPSADMYGVGIFSRLPLHDLDTFYYEEIPNISGTIAYGDTGSNIRFVASHTTPPLFQAAHHKMQGHLTAIAEYSNTIQMPMLVLGDFYAPPWCREIQDLKYNANLLDSRRTAKLDIKRLFVNPVDYILHCDRLNCVGFESVNNGESTHIGIKGAYQLKSTADL